MKFALQDVAVVKDQRTAELFRNPKVPEAWLEKKARDWGITLDWAREVFGREGDAVLER